MESCPIEKFFGQVHRTGNTIFHEIAHDGLLTVLHRIEKSITQPYNHILQKTNNDGDSCIHVAASEHRDQHAINIIKALVDLGADLNGEHGFSKYTVLHLAVWNEDYKLVEWLCQQPQINMESDGWSGLTAYQMAFIENNQRMMNILQTHGASCEMPNEAASELSDENVET